MGPQFIVFPSHVLSAISPTSARGPALATSTSGKIFDLDACLDIQCTGNQPRARSEEEVLLICGTYTEHRQEFSECQWWSTLQTPVSKPLHAQHGI